MPDTNQHLEALFVQYNKGLKPYLIALEAKTEMFPQGILNEIRALFDHCARTSLDGLTEKQKQLEIESAQRHIYRASYDCLKELCLYYARELEQFEKNYKGIRLGDVDSGQFYPRYIEMKQSAEKLTKDAKHCEEYGMAKYKEASEQYQDAILQYDKTLSFIQENSKTLAWSTQNQKKYFWKSHVITAIISLIVGIIVTLAGNYLYDFITCN